MRIRLAGRIVLVLVAGMLACTEAEILVDGVFLQPNGDVLAASEEVVINEDVPGDAMAAGRSVRFEGTIGGSFLGTAGDQRIAGRVDGSIRAAGGTVEVDASVGRNVTIVGGGIEIAPDASIGGNAYLAGGSVRLGGTVDGDVYVGAREVEIDGEVGGDVRIEAGTLTVGPEARIGGELRYRIEEEGMARISNDAVATEGVRVLDPRETEGDGIGFDVLRLLAFLLAGTVLVALFPRTAADIADEIPSRAGAALGLGLVWVLLVPVVVVVTAATVIGIPLAVLLAVLYGASLYLAPVVAGLWLGGEILSGRHPDERGGAVVLFLAGGGIVAVAILLPWIGLLARALATCLGLGALVLTVRDRGANRQWSMRR